MQRIADYGKLGHGEVVGVNIPQSKIGDFAELYFSLYNPKTKGKTSTICCIKSGPGRRPRILFYGWMDHHAEEDWKEDSSTHACLSACLPVSS
jgi:hypothetical protein